MAGSGEESKKLQLYSYFRSSCAFRVRIALNLKGLDYEYKAVGLLKGEQRDPEYLKLNPLGYVPTLVDGDAVIADSFAIIMYLEEKYPHGALLPQDRHKRAINYQAANIVSANIQPLQNLAVLNYIKEKVGPNETIPWVLSHIKKGFEGLDLDSTSACLALQKLNGILLMFGNLQMCPKKSLRFLDKDTRMVIFIATHFCSCRVPNLALAAVTQPIKQGQLFAIINIPAKAASAIVVALEKLLKDYAGKYATGDEVYMADLFLAPQIHAAIKRFGVDMNQFPTLLRVFEAYQELPAFQDALPEKQPDATC